MKEIKLSRGYVALVDDEDFERVNQFKWYATSKDTKKSKTVYALRNISKDEENKNTLMHRFIVRATDPKRKVDHDDFDGLNNQKGNLRAANNSQSGAHRKKMGSNTSGFKGVSWHKAKGKWYARIMVGEKSLSLGYFTDPMEAACAYDMAAVKYFDKFADCNFAICT